MTVKKNRRKQRFRTVSGLSVVRPNLLIYAIVGIPIRAGYDSSTGPSGMELLVFDRVVQERGTRVGIRSFSRSLAVLAALLLMTGRADARSLLFSATVDAPESEVGDATVTAEFSEVVNGNFTLTLSYLSAEVAKKFVNVAVLTGFTWDTDSTATIVADSATVADGSMLVERKQNGRRRSAEPAQPDPIDGSENADVSPWWMFRSDLAGVGTAGGSLFGRSDMISTGGNPGSVDYGLVPASGLGPDIDFNVRQTPVIQSSLVLSFKVTDGEFDPLTEITGGEFLFGSDLHARPAGPGFVNPEPSSLTLLGIGVAAVAGGRWRKRRRSALTQA